MMQAMVSVFENIVEKSKQKTAKSLIFPGNSFLDAERKPWLHLGQSILALEPQKSYHKTTNHCSMVCGQH